MKTLAALFVVAALALSACDGGDVIPANDGMAGAAESEAGGAAGAAGATGAAGAGDMRGSTGGAGGAGYTPDPLSTCPNLTSAAQLCAGYADGTAPTFNSSGSVCVLCTNPIYDQAAAEDCAIRDPVIMHSNGTTTGSGRDKACLTIAECANCH